MPWAFAFMVVGMFFVVLLPVILEQVEGIVRAWRQPRERAPEKPAAPKPAPVYKDICHDQRCPGYGTTLTHKCHDLDCMMHPKKKVSA